MDKTIIFKASKYALEAFDYSCRKNESSEFEKVAKWKK